MLLLLGPLLLLLLLLLGCLGPLLLLLLLLLGCLGEGLLVRIHEDGQVVEGQGRDGPEARHPEAAQRCAQPWVAALRRRRLKRVGLVVTAGVEGAWRSSIAGVADFSHGLSRGVGGLGGQGCPPPLR